MFTQQKLCNVCGASFIAHAPNTKTCSTRCKQKGERARRRERDGAPPHDTVADPRLFGTVHSPTLDDMDRFAATLRANAGTDEKAYVLTGTVPDWLLPPDIMLVRQVGDGSLVMTWDENAHAMREFDRQMQEMYATPTTP